MNNPEIDKPTLIELFLGFDNTVMVIEPGLLGCEPQQCLIGTIQKEVDKQRIVLNSIVWRKRN